MTDNEIIIDGVNVAECEFYYVEQETDQIKCDNFNFENGYCKEHKNCYFKQLAREKAKNRNLTLQHIEDKAMIETLKGECENCDLKAKNEKLERQKEQAGEIIDTVVDILYPTATDDEKFDIIFNDEFLDELRSVKAKNAELEADIATIKEERDNLRFKNEYLEAKVKELEEHNITIIPKGSNITLKNCDLSGLNKITAELFIKQANVLREIKELASFHITDADCEDVQNDMKQILELVKEVEQC